MKMLQQLKSSIVQKLSGPELSQEPSKVRGQGVEPDFEDVTEQLFEIAGELDVVTTAFMSTEFSDDESYGLCLILRRQTKRIRLISTEICASG